MKRIAILCILCALCGGKAVYSQTPTGAGAASLPAGQAKPPAKAEATATAPQAKPPESKPEEKAKPAEEKPETIAASADFLKTVDRLEVMSALQNDLRIEARGLTDAADRLGRQMNELIQRLNPQVPAGYEWDQAARNFKLTKGTPAPDGAPAPSPDGTGPATPETKPPAEKKP